jgi:hypothetical protein
MDKKTRTAKPSGCVTSEAAETQGSAQADLSEDTLTGEQLGAQTDHEAQHGQAAIPGFSEGNETEAGGGVGHDRSFKKL